MKTYEIGHSEAEIFFQEPPCQLGGLYKARPASRVEAIATRVEASAGLRLFGVKVGLPGEAVLWLGFVWTSPAVSQKQTKQRPSGS